MRYLATKSGTVHVVERGPDDPHGMTCGAAVRALNSGEWKGKRSLKPEQALEMKNCLRCGTHSTIAELARRANGKPVKRPLVKPKSLKNIMEVPEADERTTAKATEHAQLARNHGWDVTVTANDKGGLTVTAQKGNETNVLTYRAGGFLDNPGIVAKFPGRTVPLHNSGTWRRQVTAPEGKRPISAQLKRPSKAQNQRQLVVIDPGETNGVAIVDEVDAIPLNKSSLPFAHDAEDSEIIDHIRGRTLYWRNNMAAKVASAILPSKPRLFRFGATRTGRRYVSFPELAGVTEDGEVLGAERSVAIEDMLRVR
jgi:hypothetical protein